MFLTKLLISVFEFVALVAIAALSAFVNYRVFVKANPDFDQEEEIKKGNVAVGILVAAIMAGASIIIHEGLTPILTLIRLYFTAPSRQTITQWQLPVFALGHFLMVFVLTVFTISFSLRLFGKLTTKIQEGKELHRGNVAVGVVLASFILIVSFYVSGGVGSLARTLIPQPAIGKIQVLK